MDTETSNGFKLLQSRQIENLDLKQIRTCVIACILVIKIGYIKTHFNSPLYLTNDFIKINATLCRNKVERDKVDRLGWFNKNTRNELV